MKKQILVMGIMMAVLFNLMALPTYAAGVTLGKPAAVVNGNTVTLTYTASGVESGGTEISLLVVTKSALVGDDLPLTPETLNIDNVVYIDQKKALSDGNGTFTFVMDDKFKSLPLRAYNGASGAAAKVFVDFNLNAALLGDVNGDGAVNIKDVLLIYQYSQEQVTFTPAEFSAADVNQDGKVNMQDALMVNQYFRGEITSFN